MEDFPISLLKKRVPKPDEHPAAVQTQNDPLCHVLLRSKES